MVSDLALERRDALADVVIDLVGTEGFDAVSIRTVARAAGVSIGAVQHHFPTRAALLAHAFERVVARTRHRLAGIAPSDGAPVDPVAALSELLPLDAERRAEAAVHLAFAAQAATNPDLQAIQHALLADVHDELTDALGSDRTRAIAVLAVVDGLALHRISAPDELSDDDLVAALRTAIESTGPRRRTRRRRA